jgi:hypothetical protein
MIDVNENPTLHRAGDSVFVLSMQSPLAGRIVDVDHVHEDRVYVVTDEDPEGREESFTADEIVSSRLLDVFEEAYESYILNATWDSHRAYGLEKVLAADAAFDSVPELESYYNAWRNFMSKEGLVDSREKTPEEKLGQLITTRMSHVILRTTRRARSDEGTPRMVVPKNGNQTQQPEIQQRGATRLYLDWIKSGNSFIPKDALLSHFTGYVTSSFSYARRKAAEEIGCVIGVREDGLGYDVILPLKERVKHMTREELETLVFGLLDD